MKDAHLSLARSMNGRRSRNKGARVERAILRALQANGFAATKMSHNGRELHVEVKARADGSRELYGWLNKRDVLIVKADRQEPLVIVRMSLAAELSCKELRDVERREENQS